VAPLADARLRSEEYKIVRRTAKRAITLVPDTKPLAPVRVRLKPISYREAQAYPSDGQHTEWSQRLKGALGTASSDFVNTSLVQLVSAARLPLGPIYRDRGECCIGLY
jgi:hypothetical protein